MSVCLEMLRNSQGREDFIDFWSGTEMHHEGFERGLGEHI